MADLAKLKVIIDRSSVNPAIKDLKSLSDTASIVERNTNSLSNSFVSADGKLKGFNSSIFSGTNILKGFAAGSLAAVSAVIALTKNMIDVSEKYAGANARLKLLTSSNAEYAAIQNKIYQVAQNSNTSLLTTIELYSKLTRNTRNLNLSEQQRLSLTETINKAAVVSGATTEEQANSLRQFMQSLQGGVMRAEEYNSVMEQTPRIMEAVADGLGVNVGELRKMVVEGRLTTDVLLNGLFKGAEKVKKEFDAMQTPIAKAKEKLSNTWDNIIIGANDSTQATGNLAGLILSLAKIIEDNKDGIQNAFILIGRSINYAVDRLTAFANAWALFDAMRKGKVSVWDWVTADDKDAKKLLGQINQVTSTVTKPKANNPTPSFKPIPVNSSGSAGTGSVSKANSYQDVLNSLKDERLQLQLTEQEYKIYQQIKTAGVKAESEQANVIRQQVIELDNLKKSYEQNKAFKDVINDLAEQKLKLQSTNLEWQIHNNLLKAGVKAESDMGKQIVKNTTDVYNLSEALKSKTLSQQLTEGIANWGKSFATTLNDMLYGAKTTFASIFESFAKMITQIVIESQIVKPLLSSVGINIGANANGGAYVNGVKAFASGGAFTNSIVSSPTFFDLGLMGEKGAEAILPLTRINGALGVQATVQSSQPNQNITVRVINQSGEALQAKQTKTTYDESGMVLDIVMDGYVRNKNGFRDMLTSR